MAMRWQLGPCGVSFVEVAEFVEGNLRVRNWLRKYLKDPRSEVWLSGGRLHKARMLCRFFKWLRVAKEVHLSPDELLNRQLKLRQSDSVKDRQWLLSLVLEHSRDNPDFSDFSDSRKYEIFGTVKNFCDNYEVPLTIAKGVYGKKRRKKNQRKQINLSAAKKILGSMNQRNRTICLIQLQSGMEIGAVLNKFSYMWRSQVKPQLDADRERLKIQFDERKGNGQWYFTFISRDGIHELRKWLDERRKIVEGLLAKGKTVDKRVLEGEPIFITSTGTPLREALFLESFSRKMKGKVTSHMFRKLFKSEASVPDRAVDRNIVEFFMGHIGGIDAVGGDYDRTPEIHEEIFEREYAKLEPYVNIYSSFVSADAHEKSAEIERLRREVDLAKEAKELLTDPEVFEVLKGVQTLCQLPGGHKFFKEIVENANDRLREMQEKRLKSQTHKDS